MSTLPAGCIEPFLRALGMTPRRVGDEWVARCPNGDGHARGDRNPSWRMLDRPGDPRHAAHHCFPCRFGGGPAELVMQVRGYMEVSSALAWLDTWLLENPPPAVVTPALPAGFLCRPGGVRSMFALPPEVVSGEPLAAWPGAFRGYAEARGLTAAQVEGWGLGYAVHGRLGGRLVLPARDRAGHVRNYTARTILPDALRYLSADRREGPDWGCLFGEQHWPEASARDVVVVTEGALNALCVARAVPHVSVAALSGSQLHPVHPVKLGTFRKVVLLTDPDMAGDGVAAMLMRALQTRVSVVRVRLPSGMDALDVGDAGVRSVLEREVFDGQDPYTVLPDGAP